MSGTQTNTKRITHTRMNMHNKTHGHHRLAHMSDRLQNSRQAWRVCCCAVPVYFFEGSAHQPKESLSVYKGERNSRSFRHDCNFRTCFATPKHKPTVSCPTRREGFQSFVPCDCKFDRVRFTHRWKMPPKVSYIVSQIWREHSQCPYLQRSQPINKVKTGREIPLEKSPDLNKDSTMVIMPHVLNEDDSLVDILYAAGNSSVTSP